MSTHLQLDCLYLKKTNLQWNILLPYPTYFLLYSTSSGRDFLPLVTAAHEISPTCSCMRNPGEEECMIQIRALYLEGCSPYHTVDTRFDGNWFTCDRD